MTNQELFSQAIADAKTVRDAAVANAKAALEETFTPKIMSMLSAKLNELEEEDLEEKKEVEEKDTENEMSYENDSMDETDLEEILAQLETKEKNGKDMDEAKKKDMDEAKKKDMDEAKKKDMDEAEAESDDEVTELTVDELKDIIRDVLKDVLANEDEETEDEETEDEETEDEETEDEETEDEESISLDELLAELDKEDEDNKNVEETHKKDDKKVEEAKKAKKDDEKVEEAKKNKKDLEEAIKTIKFLQVELNEVNLLNAKLLYTNKIFKSKYLNEAQKVKVLKAFDKATNVKDVKTVYNTLSESLTTKTKNTIKESVGFASKAAGIAPARPIVESDAAIRRMQQLAGIIK